jgi:hypothetical protein
MKKVFFSLILISITLFTAGILMADKKAAEKYNTEGMTHYRSKNYEKAAVSFQKAIASEIRHKKANYNLACVFSILYECGEVNIGDQNHGREIIYTQLARALELDRQIKVKALKDKDFQKIRQTAGFWHALGYDLANRNTIRQLLPGSLWYTGRCSNGVFGCEALAFGKNQSVTVRTMGPECGFPEDKLPEAECAAIRKKNRGTWEVSDKKIILRFQDGRVEEYGFPNSKGIMKEIKGENKLKDFDPEPCSA